MAQVLGHKHLSPTRCLSATGANSDPKELITARTPTRTVINLRELQPDPSSSTGANSNRKSTAANSLLWRTGQPG